MAICDCGLSWCWLKIAIMLFPIAARTVIVIETFAVAVAVRCHVASIVVVGAVCCFAAVVVAFELSCSGSVDCRCLFCINAAGSSECFRLCCFSLHLTWNALLGQNCICSNTFTNFKSSENDTHMTYCMKQKS